MPYAIKRPFARYQSTMRRAKILLVDDNRVNRKLLAAVLEADGHRVDEAGSGREAVEGVRLFPYDLVLMVIQMADMDGMAAAAAIRALGGRRGETPIVAISGDVGADVEDRCRRAGVNEHLAKPVSPVALQQVVERWINPAAPSVSSDRLAPDGATPFRLGGLGAHLAGAALAGVVDEFTAGSSARMDDIERQTAAGEMLRVRALAHDLSGTAANLGLVELSRVAKLLEATCIGSDAGGVGLLLPKVRAALEHSLQLLAAERQRAAKTGDPAVGPVTDAGSSPR